MTVTAKWYNLVRSGTQGVEVIGPIKVGAKIQVPNSDGTTTTVTIRRIVFQENWPATKTTRSLCTFDYQPK